MQAYRGFFVSNVLPHLAERLFVRGIKEIDMHKIARGVVTSLFLAAPMLAGGQVLAMEPGIEALNEEHKRAVRRAQRVCSAGEPFGFIRRPNHDGCVVGEVERFVHAHENPAMLTFHENLPARYRYDGQRPGNALRHVKP